MIKVLKSFSVGKSVMKCLGGRHVKNVGSIHVQPMAAPHVLL